MVSTYDDNRAATDDAGFYYNNGQRVPLERDTRRVAVRFAGSIDRLELDQDAQTLLRRRSADDIDVPHYGIAIRATDDPVRAVRVLNEQRGVAFASPVFRQSPRHQDPIVLTLEFIAQFREEVTEERIAEYNRQNNVRVVSRPDYAPRVYVLEAPPERDGLSAIRLANRYFESGLCLWAHPNFIKQLRVRSAPVMERPALLDRDTRSERAGEFLSQQWHLTTAKVTDAWGVTRGNSSIKVAVLDDGMDLSHPEFAGKVFRQFDFANNTADANPKDATDNHGTACAGVAVAAGVKAFGAAPNCSLIAVRTPGFLGVSDEARMFTWAADNGADVISCSWGPEDGTGATDPLPDATRAAIHEIVRPGGRGRSGKGIAVFWAAGNGNESVSLDGYASNPEVIAVGAANSSETRSWYSDFGPEVWICAPSSGDSNLGQKRIFTTDRRGSAGYNTGSTANGDAAGDYTSKFGGTSSATPLAAGIAGLILSVNPNLTAQQVRDVLKDTADKIGSGYDGSGHSPEYGYGRVNALRAVQRAQQLSGGSGGGTTTGRPTMTGPAGADRNGPRPTFQVNPAPNSVYAVEFATSRELLAASAGRTANNYYGSWADTPFMNSPSYTMPQAVWDRLKAAAQLFYRLHTSSSTSGWTNYLTSHDPQNAPTMQITAAGGGGSTPSSGMSGPSSAARSGAAPAFQVNPAPNQFYAVEFAARRDLFDNQAARTSATHYGSWEDTPFMSAASYTMPAAIWQRLGGNNELYYRAHTSAGSSGWTNYKVTQTSATAPVLAITGPRMDGGTERMGIDASTNGVGEVTVPLITAASSHDRGDGPPVFVVRPGENAYVAIEVASDPLLFDLAARQSEREYGRNFYASWLVDGLRRADGVLALSLDAECWAQMRSADAFYYRAITAANPSGDWAGCQKTTPDAAALTAPRIDLVGGHGVRTDQEPALHPEERRWYA